MDELRIFCSRICEDIRSGLNKYVNNLPENGNFKRQDEEDTLHKCGSPIMNLLCRQAKILCQKQGDWALLQRRLDDLISLAKEKFYAYPFKDVPECWRRLFTDASILKACSLTIQWRDDNGDVLSIDNDVTDAMVRTLDLAIIMAGAPGAERRVWIEKIMSLLEALCGQSSTSKGERPSKRQKTDNVIEKDVFPESTALLPQVQHPIQRVALPSFDMFEKYIILPRDSQIGPRPLIIGGVMEHWPACNMHPWKRPSYLLSKTLNGRRLVPIEIGRSYVDDGWGQQIIPFKEFVNDYLLKVPSSNLSAISSSDEKRSCYNEQENYVAKGPRIGYLAQHDLFTQVPSLRADISIPDYCYTSAPPPHPSSPLASKHSAVPTLEEPLLNAWLGPAGTISPMHVDPYHNILAQVVGRKYIRLYAPGESEKLYPRGIEGGGVDMCNTSVLDIGVLEGWDGTKEDQKEALQKYPLYSRANYVDTILEEGDCLYIPLGWWHYVRSLSVSFSASFWWN